jgi:hypothetical protein
MHLPRQRCRRETPTLLPKYASHTHPAAPSLNLDTSVVVLLAPIALVSYRQVNSACAHICTSPHAHGTHTSTHCTPHWWPIHALHSKDGPLTYYTSTPVKTGSPSRNSHRAHSLPVLMPSTHAQSSHTIDTSYTPIALPPPTSPSSRPP